MSTLPIFSISKSVLPRQDGNRDIKLLSISNTHLVRGGSEPLEIVFGNGAFGGVHTLAPLAKFLVGAATDDNRAVKATLHRDPWLGSNTYAESYRAERLSKVVQHIAMKKPVHVIGHSWSWPGVVQIAQAAPELFSALEAFTPTGHRGEQAAKVGWSSMLRSGAAELSQIDRNAVTRSVTGANSIAFTGPARMILSGALHESVQAFKPEVTQAVIDLRAKAALPIGMMLALNDAFFAPPQAVKQQLSEAGVELRTIPATHSGAAAEASYGVQLYDLAYDLQAFSSNN